MAAHPAFGFDLVAPRTKAEAMAAVICRHGQIQYAELRKADYVKMGSAILRWPFRSTLLTFQG